MNLGALLPHEIALLAVTATLASALIGAATALIVARVNAQRGVHLEIRKARLQLRLRQYEPAYLMVLERAGFLNKTIGSSLTTVKERLEGAPRLEFPAALYGRFSSYLSAVEYAEEEMIRRLSAAPEHVTEGEVERAIGDCIRWLSLLGWQLERDMFMPPPRLHWRYQAWRDRRWLTRFIRSTAEYSDHELFVKRIKKGLAPAAPVDLLRPHVSSVKTSELPSDLARPD